MLLSVISFSISHFPRGSTAQIQHTHRQHVSGIVERAERAREGVDSGVGERASGEIERVDGVGEGRVELGQEEAQPRVPDRIACP